MTALRDAIDRFDPALPIERAATPPAAWYLDPAFAALERRAVFRDAWHPACRLDQVARPGDFVAGRTLDLCWVVVRGDDGELRALANVCRHKAAEVCSGAGRNGALRCPYHGWTYRLDGTLRSAPGVAGIEDFDRQALSLPALGIDAWGPLVFVHRDPAARPLHERFPEVHDRMEATGWGDLQWVARRTWQVDCNWKVFCDNYLDGGYHVAQVHPELADQIELEGYRTETFAHSSLQSCPPAADRIGEGALYAFLYPHLMLNRYGPCLDTNLVRPLGPDRCEVVFDFFFDPDTPEQAVQASMADSARVQEQDVGICASVQRGMASGTWERGRYAPRIETALHQFHCLLAGDLRAAAARDR